MCLAIPGRIESITDHDPLSRSASVSFSGIRKSVNIAFVPQAKEGDYVIVHAGIAISTLDANAAERILDDLNSVGGP